MMHCGEQTNLMTSQCVQILQQRLIALISSAETDNGSMIEYTQSLDEAFCLINQLSIGILNLSIEIV